MYYLWVYFILFFLPTLLATLRTWRSRHDTKNIQYTTKFTNFMLIDLTFRYLEQCMLSNDVYDYYIVSQGKTTIPNVDDGEECLLTDVSSALWNRRL